MPTDSFNDHFGVDRTTFQSNSFTEEWVHGGWNRQVVGSRTYIKRPKPRSAYIAPTAYSLSTYSMDNSDCFADLSFHPAGYNRVFGPIGSFNSAMFAQNAAKFPPFSQNLLNGVITDLRLKVKDQKVNFAQAYAEKRMTANLLADSLTRIARSINALRRGNWRDAGKQLGLHWKTAPASWLEYQYGWKPLLQDVQGSIDLLRERTEKRHWLMTVKQGRSEPSKFTASVVDAHSLVQLEGRISGETFRGIFARVDYAPGDAFFARLAGQLGFTNPTQLAWELLPYSFVIDWGVQVGDYLASLDATTDMEFYGGSYTDRRELNMLLTPLDARYGGNGCLTKWRKLPRDIKFRNFLLSRNVWSSWPVASAPRFKDPTSLTHVANALSLLTEALRRGPVRVR